MYDMYIKSAKFCRRYIIYDPTSFPPYQLSWVAYLGLY